MKASVAIAAAIVLVAVTLAGGYYWGRQTATAFKHDSPPSQQSMPRVDGASTSSTTTEGRRVKYYRNPMGLADTSPVPKKDPMGMDYIPVYEGDEIEQSGSVIKLSLDRVQKLGVRTEVAAVRTLTRSVRAVGTLQVDERRLFTVAPRFEGYIERLHVNTVGQTVSKGDPLMEVYSPDLVTAQQEYSLVEAGRDATQQSTEQTKLAMARLKAGVLERLRNWGISEEELKHLGHDMGNRFALTLRSPASGVVLEKAAVQGMRFMPGEMLYRIADLSHLWLLADVFEQDLALVRPGQSARIAVNAYPDKQFHGRVAFVYPTLNAETRTAKVRIELANPAGLLKPAMYASVELQTPPEGTRTASVPDSAVLDTGTRQIVIVQRGEGLFEPREVKVGTRGNGYIAILDGVKEGETVVVAANFLIDAESNLRAALGTLGGHGAHGAAPAGKPPVEQPSASPANTRDTSRSSGKAAPPAQEGAAPAAPAQPAHQEH